MTLTIDQYIHSQPCIERFANADGLVGVLKGGDEEPSASVGATDDTFRAKRIWSENAVHDAWLSEIETNFLAEVEACLAKGTVTSQRAITEYLSVWDIRSSSIDTYEAAVREHEATTKALAGLVWGVQRASGPTYFVCPDRPNGVAYIPITREVTLVANVADGMATEMTVRLWNKEARDNGKNFVIGRPDDILSLAHIIST
jgi:hypothetical protein